MYAIPKGPTTNKVLVKSRRSLPPRMDAFENRGNMKNRRENYPINDISSTRHVYHNSSSGKKTYHHHHYPRESRVISPQHQEMISYIHESILCGFKDAITGIFAIKNHYNSASSSTESSSSPTSSPSSSSPSPSSSRHGAKLKARRKSNKNTFQMICQCCLLNGCIFWFSLVLFDYVLLPMLYSFIHVIFGSQPGVVQSLWYWMKPILNHTFDALWRIPVFILTRIVNSLWFQDIADSTYTGRPSFFSSLPNFLADTLFSSMIQALFLIQSLVIAFIPFPLLGQLASLFHLSLLYALYSFEYKWSNMGLELHKRLQVIENNWPYFFGFGFPLVILTSLSDSWFVSGCIFSLLFPLFIISGNEAKPERGLCDQPIKIFQPVVWFSNKIFQSIIRLTTGSQGKELVNRFQSR